MKPEKLLQRLTEGSLQNVSFRDMMNLAQAFGFQQERISGSHHILKHSGIRELVNLQEVKRQAKPYQIRQFLRLVERHNLELKKE